MENRVPGGKTGWGLELSRVRKPLSLYYLLLDVGVHLSGLRGFENGNSCTAGSPASSPGSQAQEEEHPVSIEWIWCEQIPSTTAEPLSPLTEVCSGSKWWPCDRWEKKGTRQL